MKKHILFIILSFGIFSPVISAPQGTVPTTTTISSSEVAAAAACVVGGTLVAYGLYKWLYAPSKWTVEGIKKEAEGLIRNQSKALAQAPHAPIIWNDQPIVTENLPRNRAMITMKAFLKYSKQNPSGIWFMQDIIVNESDNPKKDLKSPGVLAVNYFMCDETQPGQTTGGGTFSSLGR
jgi:hypothetical protein